LDRLRERGLLAGLLSEDEAADPERVVELIFAPGLSTASEVSRLSGRGIGMDVLKSEVTSLGGRIEVVSSRGQGTTFRLYLPLTLAVTKALLVRSGKREYAIPSAMIEQVLDLKEKGLSRIREAREAVWTGNHYPFHYLPHLLGETQALPEKHTQYWALLLRSGTRKIALQVDELLGNQEIVVKNIGPQLARVIGIDGATVLGNGQVLLILNPIALASRDRLAPAVSPVPTVRQPLATDSVTGTVPTVMIVDDSLTVRKITTRLLAREGYQVMTAKDGVDALEQLVAVVPDVMLVDIEMPRMDGFELTRNIRADKRLGTVPIIMITSRTADKHRQYALELGVNHYLGKPYQEDELLRLVSGHVRELRHA
ncbi:MAG: response regulator, partial [Candidatus Accumulibacter sp.]|nr:response regulator [Accumulibacter sp.]